jgi:hypothetical protein
LKDNARAMPIGASSVIVVVMVVVLAAMWYAGLFWLFSGLGEGGSSFCLGVGLLLLLRACVCV